MLYLCFINDCSALLHDMHGMPFLLSLLSVVFKRVSILFLFSKSCQLLNQSCCCCCFILFSQVYIYVSPKVYIATILLLFFFLSQRPFKAIISVDDPAVLFTKERYAFQNSPAPLINTTLAVGGSRMKLNILAVGQNTDPAMYVSAKVLFSFSWHCCSDRPSNRPM